MLITFIEIIQCLHLRVVLSEYIRPPLYIYIGPFNCPRRLLKDGTYFPSLCTVLYRVHTDCGHVTHAYHRWGPEFASLSLHVGFVVYETGLGKFFSGFLTFSLPQISFHHFSTLISSISFHLISSAPVMVRQAWSVGSFLFTNLQYRSFIASHPSARSCVGHDLRMFINIFLFQKWGENFFYAFNKFLFTHRPKSSYLFSKH